MSPPSHSVDHLNPGEEGGGSNHGSVGQQPANRSCYLPPNEKISLKAAQPQVEDVLDGYRRRLEDLVDTYWPDAVGGEHKSAELVRKLLQQHAALFGIGGSGGVTASGKPDESDDELAKLRARRAGA